MISESARYILKSEDLLIQFIIDMSGEELAQVTDTVGDRLSEVNDVPLVGKFVFEGKFIIGLVACLLIEEVIFLVI